MKSPHTSSAEGSPPSQPRPSSSATARCAATASPSSKPRRSAAARSTAQATPRPAGSSAAAARWRAHFECLWDLYRSIPSLEIEGASVLDEFYWLNKDDPNRSLQRATIQQGADAKTGMDFTLTGKARREIIELVPRTPRAALRQAHQRGPRQRLLRLQLLALLAHHVRLRRVAQRARDEALCATLHPRYPGPARLQRPQVHQIQPVRIPRPPRSSPGSRNRA